ncbi:MAG: V-type ATP synthase subunit F [Spirochaetaceae bacterium]|nr:V-type ATP synthase subunit F [Spirochaetaceae bacterium]
MPDFFFIGEEELCVAFRLVGVDGRAVANREEALEAFLVATGQGLPAEAGSGAAATVAAAVAAPAGRGRASKVLVMSSETAAMVEEEAKEWQFGGEYPLIVEIPSPGAGPDEGRSLVAAIREAVGISI